MTIALVVSAIIMASTLADFVAISAESDQYRAINVSSSWCDEHKWRVNEAIPNLCWSMRRKIPFGYIAHKYKNANLDKYYWYKIGLYIVPVNFPLRDLCFISSRQRIFIQTGDLIEN